MDGERRIDRAVAGLAGVITAVIALVVARPYDGAMFRSAASGTTWTEHLVRVRAALLRAEGADASTWLAAADYEFPPLIHWVAIPSVISSGARPAPSSDSVSCGWSSSRSPRLSWLLPSLAIESPLPSPGLWSR